MQTMHATQAMRAGHARKSWRARIIPSSLHRQALESARAGNIIMSNAGAGFDDGLAKRNAVVLGLTQALGGGNNAVLIATGSLVGAMLAPSKVLATMPVAAYVLGLWIGTLPVGALARRYGRQVAFQVGTLFGVLTGILCFLGVVYGSFVLFCLGALVGGFYAAAMHGYRFAAADTASPAFRPKAISWVMAGGVASGVIGPQLIILTKDLWPPFLFAPTFIGQALLAVGAGLMLMVLRLPKPVAPQAGDAPKPVRPLKEIARQPRFIAAVVCGVASFGTMNLVMTSAPLAMLDCNHSVNDAALGLQWHVIAMYLPGFITGSLIARFGVDRIIMLGFILLIVSALVSMAGITVWHFWIGLILLGVGWSFSFIGATTMVTECHEPHERLIVQPLNDFLVFGTMTIVTLMSGAVLASAGWNAVNGLVFPVVLAAAALLVLFGSRRVRV